MMRPASFSTGVAFALASLALAGCGETDPGSGTASDPPASPSGSGHQVTDEVTLKVGHGAEGATLTAANDGATKVLVLLPIGEPAQRETSDGVTLTYLRSDSESTGDEPVLYEAAALSAGSTRHVDVSSVGTWTSEVRLCLEVVPADDIAAPAGDSVFRVDGGDGKSKPVVTCSEPATIT